MGFIISMAFVALAGAIYLVKGKAWENDTIKILALVNTYLGAISAWQQFSHIYKNDIASERDFILRGIAGILWLIVSLLYGYIVIKRNRNKQK